MSNKNNKAVKDAAQIIYGEVMQIIDTHVIHENPATDPRIDPSCLEALCCELDAHFTDKYGVDTQRKPLNAYTWDEIKAIADAAAAQPAPKPPDALTDKPVDMQATSTADTDAATHDTPSILSDIE